ncbi:AAA family ATPase [Mycolicibacterium neoaurum]|uniref:AAA family ATPase n=1 Tax=Mycolicibacterium neoaurum TaxID=1795 RepID=UPI00267285E0|nr:AAA family ATPase [Mycolicibacterium neoaurum]MDO3401044.1 AAA family ATPase [Mycolicibacterium neoaurum]
MRPTKAEFSGFGRLANAQINLDHKVVAIVGPNEAGKTTLLKALAYIDSGQSLTVVERSRSLPGGIPDDHVVVRVQYRLNENDQAATAHLDLNEAPTDLWLSRTAGPGDIRTEVIPRPRKNLFTLVSAFEALKSAGTTAAIADLEPDTPEDDDSQEISDERATFARRLRDALGALDLNDTSNIQSQASEFGASRWIEEFDEYGLGGDIRNALELVQEWIGRTDPTEQVTTILYNRSPEILMFSDEHRFLAPSYELTDENVDKPPAALGNIAAIAELPLAELWRSINNGDEGARETLIDQANQTLQKKFEQTWNQSKVSVHLKINGFSLEVRIKQDGRTITQFHERSAGLQMFVALVAFLTTKGQAVPPILLIDEAETHLHIDAQADLVNEFMTQTRAAKIIYTTHSPACLPPDLGTNIRAVAPDPDNGQRSVIEGSFWTKGAGYTPLMLAMGAGAAAFSAARKVVLAEGATEMLMLPTLIKTAIDAADLDYQVAPGLSEVPVSMYPELDLEGARVAFLVDGDGGGSDLRDALIEAGVPANRIVTLGALTIENLLDPDAYKQAVVMLINEAAGAKRVTAEDIPDLPVDTTSLWPKIIGNWAKAEGHPLPGKRVVASRLVEDGLARPSEAGIEILKAAHAALSGILDGATT